METKKQLREQRDNAEKRAMYHFCTILKITNILNDADSNKEMYAFTVEKIKRALADANN